MASISLESMRFYLQRSISSFNRNKLNGLLAEISLRQMIRDWGFQDRVSPGGWIVRSVGEKIFGASTAVLFPRTVQPGLDYDCGGPAAAPPLGLHTICSTFHQIGISAYMCDPCPTVSDCPTEIRWSCRQLGIPSESRPFALHEDFLGFAPRARRYEFLRYGSDTSIIPEEHVPEEFSKECLRVAFQNRWMAEVVDVDGFVWGQQYTYPVEIKEKTAAPDSKLGHYFGLDVGPFVKLAFYAARRGNLHSLFIVREITDEKTRSLKQWWAITFEQLARYASWNPVGGGKNMKGGNSTVVKIPRSAFTPFTREFFSGL